LSTIDIQPGLKNLWIIVFAYAVAAFCRFLRAAPYAIEKRIFVDFQFKDRVEFDPPGREFLIERFRLRHRSGKTVENEAVCRVRFPDAIGDNRNHDVIGHKFSTVHNVLGAESQRRARGHCCTQHLPGRQLGNAKTRGEPRRLSTFSRARRSQHN
jgi:hypothetical protein